MKYNWKVTEMILRAMIFLSNMLYYKLKAHVKIIPGMEEYSVNNINSCYGNAHSY